MLNMCNHVQSCAIVSFVSAVSWQFFFFFLFPQPRDQKTNLFHIVCLAPNKQADNSQPAWESILQLKGWIGCSGVRWAQTEDLKVKSNNDDIGL